MILKISLDSKDFYVQADNYKEGVKKVLKTAGKIRNAHISCSIQVISKDNLIL